jgi:hypothetical protein
MDNREEEYFNINSGIGNHVIIKSQDETVFE